MALCEECYGTGRRWRLPYQSVPCETCHGHGVTYCCDHAGSGDAECPGERADQGQEAFSTDAAPSMVVKRKRPSQPKPGGSGEI